LPPLFQGIAASIRLLGLVANLKRVSSPAQSRKLDRHPCVVIAGYTALSAWSTAFMPSGRMWSFDDCPEHIGIRRSVPRNDRLQDLNGTVTKGHFEILAFRIVLHLHPVPPGSSKAAPRSPSLREAAQHQIPIADAAVRQIGTLYAVEATVRGASPQGEAGRAREHSAPVIAALKPWFEKQLSMISSSSRLAEDIRYGLAHWEGSRFLDRDGGNRKGVEHQCECFQCGMFL
jgi:hypothetical protein